MAELQGESFRPRRVRIAPETRAYLKSYSVTKPIRLWELQSNAVRWFLERFEVREVNYLIANGSAVDWPLSLPHTIVQAVDKRSRAESVSASRVIYTALVLYTEQVLRTEAQS